MAKAKKAYVCTKCGAHSVKWQGQCPDCDAWNTLTQTSVSSAGKSAVKGPEPTALGDLTDDPGLRYRTGFGEFDRVLGGGLVPGSVVLLGGDPGVGKSTLLQQVAAQLPGELKTCYATGEESLRQIAQRSHRLGLDNPALSLLADTVLDNVLVKGVISMRTLMPVVDHFAATRDWEDRQARKHVTDWDLARYFEII